MFQETLSCLRKEGGKHQLSQEPLPVPPTQHWCQEVMGAPASGGSSQIPLAYSLNYPSYKFQPVATSPAVTRSNERRPTRASGCRQLDQKEGVCIHPHGAGGGGRATVECPPLPYCPSAPLPWRLTPEPSAAGVCLVFRFCLELSLNLSWGLGWGGGLGVCSPRRCPLGSTGRTEGRPASAQMLAGVGVGPACSGPLGGRRKAEGMYHAEEEAGRG